MMKKPEEIKRGLSCLYGLGEDNVSCHECPYSISWCRYETARDALALIEQLEERNNRLEYTLMGVMHSVDKWLDVEPYDFDKDDGTEAATRAANAREIVLKAIEQLKWKKDVAEAHAIAKTFVIDRLERERNAAVAELKDYGCASCKYLMFPNTNTCGEKCVDFCNWEWRGMKEEKDDN